MIRFGLDKAAWQPRGSTIGEGGDTTISSPGRSPKRPLPGMRLHDPLHGRQACPKFIAFDQGVGQICPRSGLFSCRSLPKRGQICYTPPPPLSLNLSTPKHRCTRRYSVRIRTSVFKAQHRPGTRHRRLLSNSPQTDATPEKQKLYRHSRSSRRESSHRELQAFCWWAGLLELG